MVQLQMVSYDQGHIYIAFAKTFAQIGASEVGVERGNGANSG